MSFDVDVMRRVGETQVSANFSGSGLVVLFGPSGAGKTSVLNMVAGLLTPERGHVRIGRETLFDAPAVNVPPERRRLGYVFQDSRLFPHLRVRENLLYGHRLARPEDRWMDYDDTVRLLDIAHLLDRWPKGLSGGEARRVAIGRALLSGPRALLLDEPLSFLDRARREEVLHVIERIRDTLKLPILYVTHDEREVERLATQIIEIG
ncbi:ATP-binding cassette domain-containing protein [Sphingosinicella sp.]|uniref:ATP-binding cassette domain-containing protein n=1 Tax=Sphingosinicella sp. TaxID=1917971 RepID=UPI0035AE41F7